MRFALLVAMREYGENARTKGFWIGVFMFPLILTVALRVPEFLEKKATPTREYLLIDQSGDFEDVIAARLARDEQRRVLEALSEYARKHTRPELIEDSLKDVDWEKLPATMLSPEKILGEMADDNPGMLDPFGSEQGLEMMLNQMKPQLIDDAPDFEPPREKFRRVDLPAGLDPATDLNTMTKEIRSYMTGEKKFEADGETVNLFAAILIPADIADHVKRPGRLNLPGADAGKGVQYWSANLADTDLRDGVESSVNEEIRRLEYERYEVDPKVVRSVQQTRVALATLNPKKAEGEEEVSLADVIRQWAPVGFVYLLWVAIFTVSQMLLNNTIEEKSNRIIEVLLSSLTPGELMMGKMIGILGIGLTMLGAWIGSGIAVLSWTARGEAELAIQVLNVLRTSDLLPFFALYFILGYLLYAGLFLAIGSVCNTLKEAQNLMGPIMVVMMVPLMTMVFIPRDPNGALATFLSWIPLYTPFIMMNRAAADPPMFDLVGTLVMLIASVIFSLWLAGRIFRVGILRTGQPPKLVEMLRWLRSE